MKCQGNYKKNMILLYIVIYETGQTEKRATDMGLMAALLPEDDQYGFMAALLSFQISLLKLVLCEAVLLVYISNWSCTQFCALLLLIQRSL